MTTTYCTSDELVFDNGREIDPLLDVDLTDEEKATLKDTVRVRAYNHINDEYLVGKTKVPATHIGSLNRIEIDLVISDLMKGSFSMETMNVSEWGENYETRANEQLKKLRFDASASDAVANSQNTGDGTVSTIVANDQFSRIEVWTLIAQSATIFGVSGSITGSLPNLEVGTPYPEKDWTGGAISDYGLMINSMSYDQFPFYLTITAGTADFVLHDRFSFMTYSASYFEEFIGHIKRG